MNAFNLLRPSLRIPVCLGLLVLIAFGCQQSEPRSSAPTPPVGASLAAERTPTTVALIADVEKLAQRPVTIWLPAALYPALASEPNLLLQQALAADRAVDPALTSEFVIKADEGQASLMNYLRSAQRVAPSILPDLILVDAQQLWQVAELGLLQPITLADLELPGEFYPFALEAVTINNRHYGAPYFTDLIHLVYEESEVASPPQTWAELLAAQQRFAFPGAGHGGYVDDWVLLQYLSAGGSLKSGDPVNSDAILATFTALAEGKAQDIFPAQITTLASANPLWTLLTSGNVDLASLPAHYYLGHQDDRLTYRFATLPTTSNETRTIGRVYAFALLTQNAERYQQAMTLLAHLYAAEVHDAWIVAGQWLPPDREMLAGQMGEDEYTHFLDQALAHAVALPSDRTFADFSKHLQQLVGEVLSGDLSPETAAAQFR